MTLCLTFTSSLRDGFICIAFPLFTGEKSSHSRITRPTSFNNRGEKKMAKKAKKTTKKNSRTVLSVSYCEKSEEFLSKI
ncbi:hypothetical protein RB195_004760 [Necator americanus]|uniref:Uncharacterized protein n=1 Tax=Necator americanus TaxID=51031 RepID=A0ABR1BNH0_NECAM